MTLPKEERVHSVAFTPDSRYLSISLGTGVVYVLRLEPPPK